MNKLRGLGVLAVVLVITVTGCKDDEPLSPTEQFEKDQRAITEYLADNEIQAESDSIYGVRFVIHKQGNGEKPSRNDVINIDYVGRLLGASQSFDQGDSVTFPLNNLIAGWQIALPYLREGGNMTIYIPSIYGYGTLGAGDAIPPNSNLEFDVTLNEIR